MNKDFNNKNNGITLVALVVTIIILLILAGISIASLTENGLFEKAKQAKIKSDEAYLNEQNSLNSYDEYIKDVLNNEDSINKNKDINKSNTVFLEHFDDKKYCKFGNGAVYINNTYVSYLAKEEYKLDGDFTIDYWVYESSDNTGVFNSYVNSSVNGGIWTGLHYGKYTIEITGGQDIITLDTKPKNDEWTHVAICRKNNNLSVYFNGKLQGSTQTDYVFKAGNLTIGYDTYNNNYYSRNIYIDEVRILNGVAQWEKNFTPNNREYNENQTQLVFLEHFNNTPNNIKVMTASISQNKRKIGENSLYLNNTYVSYPAKEEYKLDGDFTIDYWVYESSDNTGVYNSYINSSVNGGIWTGLYYGKYTIQITGGGDIITLDTKPKNDEWTHVAICRKNNNLSVYFNGKLQGSTQTDYVFKAGNLTIGYDTYNNNYYSKNIYIDEVRILNGVAQWEEDFTPFTKAYE